MATDEGGSSTPMLMTLTILIPCLGRKWRLLSLLLPDLALVFGATAVSVVAVVDAAAGTMTECNENKSDLQDRCCPAREMMEESQSFEGVHHSPLVSHHLILLLVALFNSITTPSIYLIVV